MSDDTGDRIGQLKRMLGDEAVLTGDECACYETGARFDAGKAVFVLRPATVQQLSSAVAFCVRNSIPIVPQSANTSVVSGAIPDTTGKQAIISLERLRQRLDIDVDNRSVHLDSGFRLSELNARLEEHGLFFPIDLGADPLVGGMVSTNTGGARFIRYGDVRRNTLGVTVVLADEHGTILDLCSHVRKNNVGVDWKQLFIGTSGVFGIIAECVLNVEFSPKQAATALLVPKGADTILPLLNILERRAGSDLTAFEGMSGNSIAAAVAHVPSLRNPFQSRPLPDYAILLELSRNRDARRDEIDIGDWLQTLLSDIWEESPHLLDDVLFGPPRDLWSLRHALSEGVKQLGKLIALDISFRRGDITRFLQRMEAELPARFPGLRLCHFGHIGDGGTHFNLVVPRESTDAGDPAYERRLRSWVYDIVVREFGGSFSAEHAIGRKNQHFYDKFTDPRLKSLSGSLKESTSPGKIGVPTFW